MNPSKFRIGLNIAIIASCFIGIFLQLLGASNFMGAAQTIFRAFTVQSNLWIAMLAVIFLVYEVKLKKALPPWFSDVKYMFTVSILLTYTVFAIVLSPVMPYSYLWSPSNWFLHTLTPMLAVVDFLWVIHDTLPRGKKLALAMIMPIGYAVYYLSFYAFVGVQPVPYFFLDYQTLGWFTVSQQGIGVIYWIILISLLVLGLGVIITTLNRKMKSDVTRLRWTIVIASSMVMLSLIMTLLNPWFNLP